MYNTVNEWNKEWDDSFDHYQLDTRHAYYVNAVISDNCNKVLEIAAGSFRDMNKLNELGIDCYGVDYSDVSVVKAKLQFPSLGEKIVKGDAFALPFKDKEFDVSYHNGFWGYFDNESIDRLLQEQIRVTKRMVIATVHNRHCQQFFEYFERKKLETPLFNIRFFTSQEIRDCISPYCEEIRVIPVGKQKKLYEDDLINIGLCDAASIKKSFDYHKDDLLDCSERLMCIGILS